jgi:thiosulfate/3-mercaptopyruvate sulfurtransferase
MPPIVSTAWLESHFTEPRIVILDVRKVEEYMEGHIPGSVNVTFGAWVALRNSKRYQLPYVDDLGEAIGSAGIGADSWVVVTCNMDSPQDQVQGCRVACTLQFAGLENMGILDCGYQKWVEEKRPVAKGSVEPKSKVFAPKINHDLFVDKAYVLSRLGKAALVDVRERDLFLGRIRQPFIDRTGRIPGTVNLPTPEAFTPEGCFKSPAELEALVAQTVGSDKTKEVITYCDTGKCCPTWAFLMRELLGYSQVRIYEGGLQEWLKDEILPIE